MGLTKYFYGRLTVADFPAKGVLGTITYKEDGVVRIADVVF